MSKYRLKYFGLSDLATPGQLNNADYFLKHFDFNQEKININDIIECHNVLKYINAGVKDRWDSETINKIKEIISKYLKQIDNVSLSELYQAIENGSYSDFWEFFSNYNLTRIYNKKMFSEFLNKVKPQIIPILQVKRIVDYYNNCIKNYFISDCNNVPNIINSLEIDNLHYNKKISLPKSLSKEDINNLIVQYVECEHPNLNYLELILNMKNNDKMLLTDKIKLRVKHRIKKETEIFFNENSGHETGVSIKYDAKQEEEYLISLENGITNLSYSLNWIKNNLDESTLLNNFIYLFGFVDHQMRITLTSKDSDIGAIEEAFFLRSKNNYRTGLQFQHKEMMAHLQLYAYASVLDSLDVNLEDVLIWFYTEYIYDNFNIQNFNVHLPNKDSAYLEKCRTIVPEIESILKKYNLYVEDGEIDLELLELSSNPLTFSNCKSLFEKKYIYPKSIDYKKVCFYFFSDQCMLHYIEGEEKQFHSFYDLMIERKVYLYEYPDYRQSDIKWLIDNEYLYVTKDEQIKINDPQKLAIIRDLYKNDTINFLNCPERKQIKINELLEIDFLSSASSLFSKNEQQYLNYYLNKKEFGNSLELRNVYAHGSQSQSEQNSEIHKLNYIIFLKIIILITIKINDELCSSNIEI